MAQNLISLSRQTRRRQRRRLTKSDINVTPMVDIMTVLLFIFMITAPLLTTGIPLDLPRANSEVMEGSDKALTISVDKEGNIYLGTDVVEFEDLMPRLLAMQRANPDIRVIISGDNSTSYGKIIELMGVLKSSGFSKVGLQTEHRMKPEELKKSKSKLKK